MSLVWLLQFFTLCYNWSCENILAGILFLVHRSDIPWQNYRIQMKIIEKKYFLIDNQQPTSPIFNLKSNSLYFVLLLLLFFLHLLLSLFASKKSPSFCLWIRAKKSPFSKTSHKSAFIRISNQINYTLILFNDVHRFRHKPWPIPTQVLTVHSVIEVEDGVQDDCSLVFVDILSRNVFKMTNSNFTWKLAPLVWSKEGRRKSWTNTKLPWLADSSRSKATSTKEKRGTHLPWLNALAMRAGYPPY